MADSLPAYSAAPSSELPSYTDSTTESATSTLAPLQPPTYETPHIYVINGKETKPLVHPEQLIGHLALLRGFLQLRETVESEEYYENSQAHIPCAPSDSEQRWTFFVGLAVERFEKWCTSLTFTDSRLFVERFMPPIDVLMVWHAYMLNPAWYLEDGLRIDACKRLYELGGAFGEALPLMNKLLDGEPSAERVKYWAAACRVPFDPIDSSFQTTQKSLLCPKCSKETVVDFLNSEGTGYLQTKFAVDCPNCKKPIKITKDVLGASKLAMDIASRPFQKLDVPEYSLAGTLFTPTNVCDVGRGHQLKQFLVSAQKLKREKFVYDNDLGQVPTTPDRHRKEILSNTKYDYDQLKKVMGSKLQAVLVRRITSAYIDDKPFSVDLVGAVLRQGSFVQKMHDFGWTKPDFFDDGEDQLALTHCIARYHAFLDLLSAKSDAFIVPTLDIDLAWHTHQLMANKYKEHCMTHFKRFIDHDDKVEENTLSTAFDDTCRAWKNRFGISYTYCGCPLPGDKIGGKLSQLRMSSRMTTKELSLLSPPSNRDDIGAATHPSDHNAVIILDEKNKSQALKKQGARKKKVEKRAERDMKGKAKKVDLLDDGEKLPVVHDLAFLIQVPMFYLSPEPGACVAPGGSVVADGKCAVGSAACAGSSNTTGGGCGSNKSTNRGFAAFTGGGDTGVMGAGGSGVWAGGGLTAS